jgi:hypothetical protein
MTNHSKLHNPNYVGPGLWYSLHSLSAFSKTPEMKSYAIQYIKNLQENFPCGECKIHFGDYIQKHPLENTINGNEESLFMWMFNFHNTVNYRLGKQIVSYEDAKKIFYTNSEYCMSDCTEEDKKPKQPRLVPKDMPGYIF